VNEQIFSAGSPPGPHPDALGELGCAAATTTAEPPAHQVPR
jgi:hypothetical protein